MKKWLTDLVKAIKDDKETTRADAAKILALDITDVALLLYCANDLRAYFKGKSVKTCSIVNAKSGRCSEDCSFCAQSAHYRTTLETYSLMSCDTILERARKEEGHSKRFGIVTAGKGLCADEIETVRQAVTEFSAKNLDQIPCASLGILTEADFKSLKQAGLTRYHHNLEACRNFYPKICTTHSYEERLQTIQAAKSAGLEMCIGGILGLGESLNDRIDLLYEIKALQPDSVPLNFLVSIEGTPLAEKPLVPLWDAIKITALSRFIMPTADIKIGGGRLEVFKDAQHLAFLAGANGMIIGDLLTIKGRTVDDDLKVLRDLGLEITA